VVFAGASGGGVVSRLLAVGGLELRMTLLVDIAETMGRRDVFVVVEMGRSYLENRARRVHLERAQT